MSCIATRRRLLEGRLDDASQRHLRGCDACTRFAERAATFERGLAETRSTARPDAGFSARVLARLPGSDDALEWAIARWLPVGAVLALVLGLLTWGDATTAAEAETDATDQVIAWVIDWEETE